ncbi:GntR family transcriptional regulator [Paenarthrobacter nitroguajacolicus]|uniref:GntR family transcriptional regulator n=1 Tax=Paenarthrobacter nitroguajacolicus TaxID=211146 RepID=UPI002867863D|nr:GntR family transcriptional regulator [Paenarthrobacter nitroguajacolicus]MDR6637041.1 DNA-binding FadR family transcriptional regulator [Paenarthrobacter nitroguajacolicus]
MASWREQLAFAPLGSVERGEEIGRRLRQAIELGVLEDGSQLPSEADLAARMGVAPLTLRAALANLRQQGLIETRRGKRGGSYVKMDTGDDRRVQRETLGAYTLADLCDIRECRAFLAGTAASAAADRSQQIAVGRLAAMATRVQAAAQPAGRVREDSRFHIELVAMAGSVRLTRQEMAMQAEMAPLLWAAAPGHGARAAAEHAVIVEAIRVGDGATARALAEAHVRQDMDLLIDQRMSMDSPPTGSPSDSDAETAISAIEDFALRLHSTASAAIHAIEQAVHAELGRGTLPKRDRMPEVYTAARRALLKFAPEVYGMGFVCEPSASRPPMAEWCYMPDGVEEPRHLDPDIEFYDLSTAPWWPADDADDTVRMSYAYIDASGTDENVITFSKPVLSHGTRVGVIGLDVLLRQIQEGFEPFLRYLPTPACIVDQCDAVIATNTGSLLGRARRPSHQTRRLHALPQVPWKLLLG